MTSKRERIRKYRQRRTYVVGDVLDLWILAGFCFIILLISLDGSGFDFSQVALAAAGAFLAGMASR